MSDTKPSLGKVLGEAFEHLQEPVLFQNMLQDSKGSHEWKLLQWNFSELAEKFGDLKLPFRIGYNAKSTSPQWEACCSVKYMTLQEFIENIKSLEENEIWYYFDYKHMQEWFGNKPEIMTSIDWCRFGLNKDGSDSTLWIGNKGAHTNCHQDSYGYNLIAQIHGRKQWLLFPPDSSNCLEPTRIPYEESTIYSKFNFFCLSKEDEKKILDMPYKPKVIILEPGDVLFVPWGWWHYVESLDLSVSVNIWLPLKTDSKARLKEALVKLTVAKIGGQEYLTCEKTDSNISYYTRLVNAALQECKTEIENTTLELPSVKKAKYTFWTVEDLVMKYPNYIKLLHNLESHELQNLLQEKRERFSENKIEKQTKLIDAKTIPPHGTFLESIVNALCHPDVINKAAELLLNDTCR